MGMKHCPPLSGDYDLEQGGAWYDERGEQICSWKWLSVARIMQVFIGNIMRPVRLKDLEKDPEITEDVLKEILPFLARSTAEEVTKQRYDGSETDK